MNSIKCVNVDIAIIGAGPAGSAAAIHLARAGRRVMLIERRHFPREKVCGGCLSGSAVASLRALVGKDCPIPGVPARQIAFVLGPHRFECDANGVSRIVLRSELDGWLARMAASAGAELHFGEEAQVVRGVRGWEVHVGDSRVEAKWILLACGLTRMAAKLGISGRNEKRRMIAQQWMQPSAPGLPELGSIEMHWLRGGYIGLATPTAGQCIVAMAAEVPENPREDAFARLRRLNPGAKFWESLPADAARCFGAKGIAGFPWMPNRLGLEKVLLIGDAAGYEEPFTGEGMAQALHSAECAAQTILHGHDVLRSYQSLIRRSHRPFARRVRLLSRVLRNPIIQGLASWPIVLPRRPLAQLISRIHLGIHSTPN